MFKMSIPTWMIVGAGEAPFGLRCPHMIQRGGGPSFILTPQKYGSSVAFIRMGTLISPLEAPPSQKHGSPVLFISVPPTLSVANEPRQLLLCRAIDYIQPDITKVGGLTEQFRIAQYADDHSILMVPHGWNTAVGLAADLQVAAAVGNARWVEYITPGQYIEPILLEPPKMDENGMLKILDGPGFGFQWNPEGVEKLSKGIKLTKSVV